MCPTSFSLIFHRSLVLALLASAACGGTSTSSDAHGDALAEHDAVMFDTSTSDVSDVATCDGATCGSMCVDTRTDVHNCGGCGHDCATLPGVVAAAVRCTNGACDLTVACLPGHAHCTSDASAGCDTDITTAAHCGSCTTACAEPTPLCSAGADGGGYACASGCSGATSTRCAMSCVDTQSDVNHCGACDRACGAPASGSATCTSGACGIACDAGFHPCGSSCASNTSVASCGTTCSPCPAPANGVAMCDGTTCGFACDAGFHACGDHCAADTSATECGTSCSACAAPANATAVCVAGACGFACNAGFHACGDHCAADNSVTECGASCAACAAPTNGAATCDGSSCGITCDAGFHACGTTCADDGSIATCGTSCMPCAVPPNATSTCDGTICGFTCMSGFGDCDGDPTNGCEALLQTDPNHCGSCPLSCTSGMCSAGACVARGTAANPGLSCLDILDTGGSTGDGTYWVNPGGGPMQVNCNMTIDGGGWTQLVAAYTSQILPGTYRYLYLLGTRWYESPSTTLVWNWSTSQQLTGTYAYFNGTTMGTLTCPGSTERPQFGVGCSSGGGSTAKVLPIYNESPSTGQCEICQDVPNAYGVGACTAANAVSVFVR